MSDQGEMFARPANGAIVQQMTVAEFAMLCGCTEKAVHSWIAEDGLAMAVIVEGRRGAGNATVLDSLTALAWFVKNKHSQLTGADALNAERTRLAKEQADKIALENAVRKGQLGEIDIWAVALRDCIQNIRTKLLGLGSKVGPRANPKVPDLARSTVDDEVHQILTEIATYEEKTYEKAEDHYRKFYGCACEAGNRFREFDSRFATFSDDENAEGTSESHE